MNPRFLPLIWVATALIAAQTWGQTRKARLIIMTFRLLALFTWFLLQESAYAQGQINLNNRGLAQVYDATGKPLTGIRRSRFLGENRATQIG